MFTGIIQSLGTVQARESRGGDLHMTIKTNFKDMSGVHLGDSIAMDGVCLTVTNIDKDVLQFDIMRESLLRTTLGTLKTRSKVN